MPAPISVAPPPIMPQRNFRRAMHDSFKLHLCSLLSTDRFSRRTVLRRTPRMPSAGRTCFGHALMHFHHRAAAPLRRPRCFPGASVLAALLIPRIGEKAVKLGQGRRTGESFVLLCRARGVAQPAENARHILVDAPCSPRSWGVPWLMPAWPRGAKSAGTSAVQPGLDPLVFCPKGVHVHDEVLEDIETRHGLDHDVVRRESRKAAPGRPDRACR